MSKPCSPELGRPARRRLLAAMVAWPLAGPGQAGAAKARRVEPFDVASWTAIQAGLRLPMAVVFTTTDCTHCPAVIRQLAQAIAGRRARALLAAVVMDQAPGDDDPALLSHAHYRPAHRLYAFDGQGPLIRHAVDPQWRGMTPYTQLLRPGAPPRAITGPIAAAELDAWLASAAPR